MNEIQMTFYTLLNPFEKNLWIELFCELERVFGQKLSHIDVNDPVRKKVSDLVVAADYIRAIGEEESSRRVFGKFGKSKIEFSISIFKEVTHFPNSLSIHFSETITDDQEGLSMLRDAFEEGNRYLKPFYSICDSMGMIASKRKATGYAVDLQAELIGTFWLTYFNKAYVDFFEEPKFQKVPSIRIEGLEGSLLDLGESPFSVTVARDEVEALLGKESFVDPLLGYDKEVGKNVLSFDKLICC